MPQVIGLDFDNTVICYDEVFQRLAVEAGLVPAGADHGQKAIREAARRSPEGDLAWQRLQGQAYGPRILEARPAEGVLAFLARCREAAVEVHIISHKTEYASVDPTRTPLREAARRWLADHGFLSPATGLGPTSFHCGGTRAEKVALIRACGCTCFVDDLVETFREATFPASVQAILYAPGEAEAPADLPGLRVARSWAQVGAWVLGG